MIALGFFFHFFFPFSALILYSHIFFFFANCVKKKKPVVLQNEAFNKPYTMTRTTINSGDIDMSGISIDCNTIVSYKISISSKYKKKKTSQFHI